GRTGGIDEDTLERSAIPVGPWVARIPHLERRAASGPLQVLADPPDPAFVHVEGHELGKLRTLFEEMPGFPPRCGTRIEDSHTRPRLEKSCCELRPRILHADHALAEHWQRIHSHRLLEIYRSRCPVERTGGDAGCGELLNIALSAAASQIDPQHQGRMLIVPPQYLLELYRPRLPEGLGQPARMRAPGLE